MDHRLLAVEPDRVVEPAADVASPELLLLSEEVEGEVVTVRIDEEPSDPSGLERSLPGDGRVLFQILFAKRLRMPDAGVLDEAEVDGLTGRCQLQGLDALPAACLAGFRLYRLFAWRPDADEHSASALLKADHHVERRQIADSTGREIHGIEEQIRPHERGNQGVPHRAANRHGAVGRLADFQNAVGRQGNELPRAAVGSGDLESHIVPIVGHDSSLRRGGNRIQEDFALPDESVLLASPECQVARLRGARDKRRPGIQHGKAGYFQRKLIGRYALGGRIRKRTLIAGERFGKDTNRGGFPVHFIGSRHGQEPCRHRDDREEARAGKSYHRNLTFSNCTGKPGTVGMNASIRLYPKRATSHGMVPLAIRQCFPLGRTQSYPAVT